METTGDVFIIVLMLYKMRITKAIKLAHILGPMQISLPFLMINVCLNMIFLSFCFVLQTDWEIL